MAVMPPDATSSAEAIELLDVLLHGPHAPAKKTPIGPRLGSDAVTASRQILGGGDVHELLGWAIAETTAAAGATIRLWDGNGTNTEVLARINLASNESNREGPWKTGVRVSTGRIYLEVISGSIEGVVFWR